MLHIKPPAQQALLEALIGVCGAMRDTSLSSSVARVLTRIPMGSPNNVCCVSYTLSLIREISKQFVKLFKLGRSRL